MRIYPAIHYTMGGLWVDYNLMSNVAGLLRARRGELLRPRREPPRRQRADAGPGRRLLRHPVHARPTTSPATPLPKVTTDHDAFDEADDSVQARIDAAARRSRARADAARDPPRARPAPVGRRRHGAQRGGPARRARANSRSCATSSGSNVSVPGDARQPEPEPRIRRPRRRLPRVRRTAGARRARAPRVVRRPLPRGEPDAGRRGAARRRALLVRGGVGVHGRRPGARSATRSRSSSSTSTRRSGATSRRRMRHETEPAIWRQAGPTSPGTAGGLRRRRRLARHVVPRDARRRQRGADQEGRGRRSRSTRTAAKASAACAAWWSTASRTARTAATTVCQLHMRRFKDGDTITIEPWRAKAFPVVKDLVVDRSAFDRIIAAGGYVSINAGGAPDANSIADPARRRRGGDGLGRLHRLRRLRRGVQERVGACSSSAPRSRTSRCCRRASRSATRRVVGDGRRRWTPKASAAARTKASAKRCARRRSPSRTSRG